MENQTPIQNKSTERDTGERDCGSPLPKHKTRLSRQERQSRVFEVLELLFSGKRSEEIIESIRARWGLGRVQASKYITEASLVIAEELTTPRDERIAFHLAVRRHLYQKAHEAGDLRLALDAMKDEAELLGLYARGENQPTVAVPTFAEKMRSLFQSVQGNPATLQRLLYLHSWHTKLEGELRDLDKELDAISSKLKERN